MQLPKAEEQLMRYLWTLEKAFMKDLLDSYPEPKPVSTTVSTLLKRLIDKRFIAYNVFGNSRQYVPLVSKREYFTFHVSGLIRNFFNDSSAEFASFFAREADLSAAQLEELKKIVEQEINKKK